MDDMTMAICNKNFGEFKKRIFAAVQVPQLFKLLGFLFYLLFLFNIMSLLFGPCFLASLTLPGRAGLFPESSSGFGKDAPG